MLNLKTGDANLLAEARRRSWHGLDERLLAPRQGDRVQLKLSNASAPLHPHHNEPRTRLPRDQRSTAYKKRRPKSPWGSTLKLYQAFRRTQESFFAHSVDQPERTELCRFGCELLISAEHERSNRMLIPSMMGTDVAGLRRASLHEVFHTRLEPLRAICAANLQAHGAKMKGLQGTRRFLRIAR